MPKGIITLSNRYTAGGKMRLNVAHIVSYFVPIRNGPETLVTVASKDDEGNDRYHVTETPEEIDALIEQAQGARTSGGWADVSRELDEAIQQLDRSVHELQARRSEVTV